MFKRHTIEFSKRATAFSSLILKLLFFCSIVLLITSLETSVQATEIDVSVDRTQKVKIILKFLIS